MPLKNDPAFIIRKYGLRDRPAVRRICCETAMMGEPSDIFFGDDEVFADALTVYFTDHEPESCFVAEHGGRVAGYLIGAKDVKRMGKIFAGKAAGPLISKALRRGVFFRKKNVRFLLNVILSTIKSEFTAPDFSKDYPATLHINISKDCRTAGIGSRLIEVYLSYLRSHSVKGVHCATMSDKAARFFANRGFSQLFKGERSYFRHILGKNVPLYIYGMKISLGEDADVRIKI